MEAADALLEDYKLKAQFATDVLNRYQTQAHIMLTLVAAVATAMILSSSGQLSAAARWIALVEVALSGVWLSVGIQGRRRVGASRSAADEAGRAWAASVPLASFQPVGDRTQTVVIGWLGPAGLLAVWVVVAAYFWF